MEDNMFLRCYFFVQILEENTYLFKKKNYWRMTIGENKQTNKYSRFASIEN